MLNLTEENKKQEPCRQHSTVSLIKYQNQYPKVWIIPKEIRFYQKNDTQKSGRSPKRYPKIRETQKGTQNNGTSPYQDICKLPPSQLMSTVTDDRQPVKNNTW